MKEKQHVCLASLAKFARSSPITLWDGSISERNLYKLARVWDIRDTPGHTFSESIIMLRDSYVSVISYIIRGRQTITEQFI